MTVGPGISPDLLTPYSIESDTGARGLALRHTAGGEFRPALKILLQGNRAMQRTKYSI